MNFANYSPYNKSFRFICYQNQAYHQKNKRNMSPHVKTNIRYSSYRSTSNPESFISRRSSTSQKNFRVNQSSFISSSQLSSTMMRSSSCSTAGVIQKQKKVIHRNQSYQKFKLQRINQQNSEMVNRLLKAQCQVVKKDHTEKSFSKHLKYRDIRKKYNDQGIRKTKMCLGNQSLLCPTLLQYNNSGLAEKFIQKDLSMSMASQSPRSKLTKKKDSFDYTRQIVNQA